MSHLPAIPDLMQPLEDATGQLSKRSRRIYEHDARVFALWLQEQGLTPQTLTYSDAVAYRLFLADRYEPATAKRMLSVARRLLEEQIKAGKREKNPFVGVKGFKVANETPYIALEKAQARALLAAIDMTHERGVLAYAVVTLLLYTGIRRTECAGLHIGDMTIEQGYHVLSIQHGKGNKRRIVKLPVIVHRAITAYLVAAGRQDAPLSSPLFTGYDRWGKPTGAQISDKFIERLVKHYGAKIGILHLSPHALRATFITLALEEGASLMQVQYAAGHEDPRTTERYQKRKLNLDDNAVDYIRL